MRSPKDGELLGSEKNMILQVSNIICPDQKDRTQYDALLNAKELEDLR